MKGLGKKVMALFLGTCLLFGAACSNGEAEPTGNGGGGTTAAAGASGSAGAAAGTGDGGQAMGRFVETECPLPAEAEYIMDLRKLEDGTLRMAAVGTNPLMLYSSADDGKSWEPVEMPMEQLNAEASMIQTVRWSSSGQLFVVYMNQNEVLEGNMKSYYLFFDQTGTGKELMIDLPKLSSGSERSNLISDVHFALDGGLYIIDVNQTIYQIDSASGKILKTYANPGTVVETFAVIGKNLLVKTENSAEFYDLETGKSLARQEALNEYIKAFDSRHSSAADVTTGISDYVYTAGKDGNDLYFCDETGLYHYTLDGSVVEQVIDGALNSLSSTTMKVEGMLRMGEESFFVYGSEEGEAKLLFYHYDSSVPTLPGTELTVYALEDSRDLRQAIRMYQLKNPDVYVALELGMSGDDGITAADAIRTLNTNLMAGKGPDVLILDGMTIDNYVEKGLLMDLTDVIEEISSTDGLFENLVHAYQTDGKVMAVPVRVMLPMILGDANGLDSITDLKSLTAYVESLRQNHPTATGICGADTAEGVLKRLYGNSSPAWLKEGNTLDEAALNEFFDCIKRIYIAEMDQTPSEGEGQSSVAVGGGGINMSDSMDLFSYLGGDDLICIGQMDSFQTFAVLETFRSRGSAYHSLNGQASGVFQPVMTAGVNAKGDQSETANEFVKYLLSKDFQSNDNTGGLPVNRAAFEAAKTSPFSSDKTPSFGTLGKNGKMIDMEIEWPSESGFTELQKQMESANIPADSNQVIREAVETELKNLLEGGTSVQDAVQNVIKKVNLYLSEQ